MKKFKAFTVILMVCLLSFSTMYTAFGAVYIEDWGYRFEKINSSVYEINKYIGENDTVTIPKSYNGFPITSIGQYAFIDTSVTSVALGDNITEIKNSAFINVDSLTVITLNDGLTTIGKIAFANCTGLTNVTFPNSVTTISDDAFDGCVNLVMHCYDGSYAHQYAVSHNIPFVLIEDVTPTEPPTDAPTSAQTEVTFILGDSDGDDCITVMDATKVQRVLADLDDDSDGMIAMRAADGQALNIMHATAIQRYLADYEVAEQIGVEVTRKIG